MRVIRPELVPVLAVAAVATRVGYAITDSVGLLFTTVLLACSLAALIAYLAIWRIRVYGGRPIAFAAPIALALLYVAMEIAGLLVTIPTIVRAVVVVVAWGGLLVAWLAPEVVVEAMGGPRPEWSLLRDRAMLWVDLEAVARAPHPAQLDLRERVLAADRYRTPATNEYIDLYEQLMLDDLDETAAARVGPRFVELEDQLRRSLGARPAWEDDVDERTRAVEAMAAATTATATTEVGVAEGQPRIEREPVGSARR
jgi:hypothetical protein